MAIRLSVGPKLARIQLDSASRAIYLDIDRTSAHVEPSCRPNWALPTTSDPNPRLSGRQRTFRGTTSIHHPCPIPATAVHCCAPRYVCITIPATSVCYHAPTCTCTKPCCPGQCPKSSRPKVQDAAVVAIVGDQTLPEAVVSSVKPLEQMLHTLLPPPPLHGGVPESLP